MSVILLRDYSFKIIRKFLSFLLKNDNYMTTIEMCFNFQTLGQKSSFFFFFRNLKIYFIFTHTTFVLSDYIFYF